MSTSSSWSLPPQLMEKVLWVSPSCWAVGGSLPGRRKGCEWVSEVSFMKCPSRTFSTRVFSLPMLDANPAQVQLVGHLPVSSDHPWAPGSPRTPQTGKRRVGSQVHITSFYPRQTKGVLLEKHGGVGLKWNRPMVFRTEVLQDSKVQRKFACRLFALDNTNCLLL